MSTDSKTWEHQQYLIRRKVFKIFGAAFHIYNDMGELIGFSKQKAFKLKEDIRIFTDENCTAELLVIQARQVIDFSANYDVFDPATGQVVGSLRRKGFKSILRDHWIIEDTEGRDIGEIKEDSMLMALIRRWVCNIIPQKYHATSDEGDLAVYKQNFNPFVQKLAVNIEPDARKLADPRLLLAAGVLLVAIEGRQNG